MSKKLWILLLAIFILIPVRSFAVQMYGHAGAGLWTQKVEKPVLASITGFDVGLRRDTAANLIYFDRTSLVYADAENQKIRALTTFAVTKKEIRFVGASIYGAIGAGLSTNFKEDKTTLKVPFKVEIGVDIYKLIGFGIGLDYYADDDPDPVFGGDKALFYLDLNLFP